MKTRSPLSLVVAALMAVLVACGGGSTTPTVADEGAGSAGTTQSGDTTQPPDSDERAVAPDFTLTLQPEGEFTLSEAGKPVYLVFWAEW